MYNATLIQGRDFMERLLPRYRVTVDLKQKYAEMLDAIMAHEDLSQSDAIRRAIEALYKQVIKA